MTIRLNLDIMLVRRGMSLSELAERVDITLSNLSVLKNKARAIRFTTLNAICRELGCQPADLLEYVEDDVGAPTKEDEPGLKLRF